MRRATANSNQQHNGSTDTMTICHCDAGKTHHRENEQVRDRKRQAGEVSSAHWRRSDCTTQNSQRLPARPAGPAEKCILRNLRPVIKFAPPAIKPASADTAGAASTSNEVVSVIKGRN